MNTNRHQFPSPEDLKVFVTVIRKNGFANAAEALGYSPAYVSKRIAWSQRCPPGCCIARPGALP
jgi:LysR family transcriptional activator of dmlA